MKTLITGGCGFIGSHLVEAVKNPVVIDNYSTCGFDSATFVEDLGVEIIKDDLNNLPKHLEYLKGVNKVYHLAAVPRIQRSIDDPFKTNESNVTGTLKLFECCQKVGIKDIVYASSSSVYGDVKGVETEDLNVKPLSPYAVSKLTGEFYAGVFINLYGMRISSLRYFNVYGKRQDWKGEYACAIPKFMNFAKVGKPLPVYGDGKQTRYFTAVKDVVDASKKAMGKKGIYNICADKSASINELAKTVIDITKSISDIEYQKPRKGETKFVQASNKKAKKELGWKPKYNLKSGLEEMLTEKK